MWLLPTGLVTDGGSKEVSISFPMLCHLYFPPSLLKKLWLLMHWTFSAAQQLWRLLFRSVLWDMTLSHFLGVNHGDLRKWSLRATAVIESANYLFRNGVFITWRPNKGTMEARSKIGSDRQIQRDQQTKLLSLRVQKLGQITAPTLLIHDLPGNFIWSYDQTVLLDVVSTPGQTTRGGTSQSSIQWFR